MYSDELIWLVLIYSYTHKSIVHPTSLQTKITIFIDEFNFIHWDLQANLIPKYGYCSEKFDDIAQGKSLIQGQLGINFVSPGYLIGIRPDRYISA